MTDMRERLIELLKSTLHIGMSDEAGEMIADHLIANGVILPPCKVGEKVYCIMESSCEDIDGVHTECEFYGFGTDDMICTIPNGTKCPYQYRVEMCSVTEMNLLMFTRRLGKTVFLTREEAEKALKEREP